MKKTIFSFQLTEALLKQKEGHDTLVDALKKEIDDNESDIDALYVELYVIHSFLKKCDVDIIRKFVEFAYIDDPERAKSIVGFLHDETIDLSTIKASKDDFDKWELI